MDKEKLKQIIEELKTIARDETSIGAETTSYAVSASNTDSSGETFDPVTGYKRIALPCKMQLAVNFVKNRRYNIFEDFPADNALMGLSIYHIFRSNLDTSKYGMGFALNLYQQIKTVGSKLFYIDELGDSYEIKDNIVKNMRYTTEEPSHMNNVSLFVFYQYQYTSPDRYLKLPTKWLIDGNITRGFNSNGNLVMISDRNNNCIQINYDTNGNITDVRNIHSTTTYKTYVFEYDSLGNLTFIRDNTYGNCVRYEYTNGSLSKITYPNGETLSISYTGNCIYTVTSSDGYESKFTLGTSFSVAIKSTLSQIPEGQNNSSLPNIANYTINISGNTAQISDRDGNTEYYVFDEERLTDYYLEENGVVTKAMRYERPSTNVGNENSNYKLICEQQLPNRDHLYISKKSDYVFSKSESIITKYNELSQPVVVTDSNKRISGTTSSPVTVDTVTNYTYENDRLIKESKTVTYKNNQNSNSFCSFTYVTEYEYNLRGMVSKKTSYVEEEIESRGKFIESYAFDDNGYEIKVTTYNTKEPNKKFVREKTCDIFGRTLTEKGQTGGVTTYTYMAGTDRVSSVTYPNGCTINYSYDSRGRLTSIRATDENGVSIANNAVYTNGEVTKLTGASEDIKFKYDGERRLKNVTLGSSDYQNYVYVTRDANGNLTPISTAQMTNAKGERFKTAAKRNCEYDEVYYNDVLQLKTTYNKDGSISGEQDNISGCSATYSYDTIGRLTGCVVTKAGSVVLNENYTYNDYGELSAKTQRAGSVTNYSYSYENNSSRKLLSVTCGTFKETFAYDIQQRYIGRTVALNNVQSWTESLTYCVFNGVETTLPQSITFTRNGSSRAITYSYDSCGNISGVTDEGKAVSYTYDKLNRLIREDNEAFGESYYYSYDTKGNITKKETAPYTTGDFPNSSASVINYTYNGDKLTLYNGAGCTYDGVGNPVIYRGQAATWQGRKLTSLGGVTFTYDGKGRRTSKNNVTYTYDSKDRLIVGNAFEFYYDDNGLTGFVYCGTKYYYQRDIQGNIIAILDRNGNLIVKYRYDAWGNHKVLDASGNVITSASHIGNVNPFRYRGYFYDIETGLYYLKTRYYDPVIGRFLNMDSIDYADPETINGLNLYAYCGNNPVMNVDPDGHLATFIIALIILGVVGLASGTASAIYSGVQGESAGDIALNFFTGFFAGVAIGGMVLLGVGVGGVLITGVATVCSTFVTLASIGAAGMAFGSIVACSLGNIVSPEFEKFPTPNSVPAIPTPITGF